MAPEPCRDTNHNTSGLYILRHYCAGTDHSALANGYAAHDDCTAPDGCTSADPAGNQFPVICVLQATVRRSAGVAVIDEQHAMADKNLIFHRDPFTNKRMGGDFAPTADDGIFLYFHKSTYRRFITDRAAVQIYEFRVVNDDAFPKRHGERNRHDLFLP